ncbi:hypothetical protein [Corynebacterium kalidii]
MSGARGAPGVPVHPFRLRLRLQMYPRVEHLLVVPLLLVVWAMLSFGGDGYRGVPWVALLSGLAMWVMVPEIGRYRAFGLPLRYWTRDAAAAVLVGAALFCAVGAVASTGWRAYTGFLLGALAVAVQQCVSARRTVRGDRRVPAASRRAGGGWATLVGRLPSVPGPLPWRLVYLPVGAASLAAAALFAGGFSLVRMTVGTADDGPLDLASAAPLAVVLVPAVAGVLAGGLRGWTVMGIPVRRWLRHAYVASAVAVLSLVALVALATSTGLVGGVRPPAQMPVGQVLLTVAFTVLCIVVVPLIATSGTVLMSMVAVVPVIGTAMTVGTADPLRGPGPVVGAVVVLAVSATVVAYTAHTLLRGDRARPTGLVQAAERTYYQRQGAL